jgi:general secretion pathway protein A
VSEGYREINPFEDGSAAASLRGLPGFEEALARLLHTAEHGRPFGIVRGPAGTGKSQLLECLGRELRQYVGVDLRRSSAGEFVDQLCDELGVNHTAQARSWKGIEDVLLGRAHAARPTVLLLDHLEAADSELIAQVERLLAVADAAAGWCSVLAAGRIPSPDVAAIARRHGELRIDLEPFAEDETMLFLQQVVSSRGCHPFTGEAAAAMHEATGGLFRDIVRLGRLALFAVSTDGAPSVSAETVWMVAGELAAPRSTTLTHRRPPAAAPSPLDALNAGF